jgi:hypothetical protein
MFTQTFSLRNARTHPNQIKHSDADIETEPKALTRLTRCVIDCGDNHPTPVSGG